MTFGAVYGLLGLSGFVFGRESVATTGHMMADAYLISPIPGILEFGSHDHVVHLILAAIFLGAAATWKNRTRVI